MTVRFSWQMPPSALPDWLTHGSLRARMAAAGNSGDPARIAEAAAELSALIANGDPEAIAIYREHQDRILGPVPLGPEPLSWPPALAEPGAVLDVPAYAPILGWRMWAVRGDRLVAPFAIAGAPFVTAGTRGRVGATTPGVAWEPGVNTASTRWCAGLESECHPMPDCHCGIRAVRSRDVLDAFAEQMSDRLGDPGAVARVVVWGRVAGYAPDDDWQHTLRAQHAKIVGRLELAGAHYAVRDAIARRYRVEVDVLASS